MWVEAVEIYRYLAQNSRGEYPNRLSSALEFLSFTYLLQSKFEQAEQTAREGIEIDNTQTGFYLFLAPALLLQGKFSEAEQIYRTFKTEMKELILEVFQLREVIDLIPEERKTDVEKFKRMLQE